MMYGGFTFNGKHSLADFGLICQTAERPLIPTPRYVDQQVGFADGSVDFSAANQAGRILYDNKSTSSDCTFVDKDIRTVNSRLAAVSAWLLAGGYQPLIYDDMPHIVWMARAISNIPIQYQYASSGKFNITFECRPLNHLTFGNDEMMLGSDIPLGSSFLLGGPQPLADGAPMFYETSAPTKPVLTLSGQAGSYMTVTCNGKQLIYNKPVNLPGIVIDCENMECRCDGVVVDGVEGEYFEFTAGYNEVQIRGFSGYITAEYPYNTYFGLEDF